MRERKIADVIKMDDNQQLLLGNASYVGIGVVMFVLILWIVMRLAATPVNGGGFFFTT